MRFARLRGCSLGYNGEGQHGISGEEAEANLKLIAAAPDMLAALKNLENDDGAIPHHAWVLAQDAIAKAEGWS